jgi:cytochrome oxidase Cu insertion factor (SCO1/SenC/PrrC family)
MPMNRMILPLAGLALLGTTGCLSSMRYDRQMRGKPAPDFELTALDGGKVRLSELRGKPVLLSFWAAG